LGVLKENNACSINALTPSTLHTLLDAKAEKYLSMTCVSHALFSFNTPNRLRSVVGGFAHNYTNFHQQASYEFFTDVILRLNTSNPQIGARLVATTCTRLCYGNGQ
jgi:aminopeptidase N